MSKRIRYVPGLLSLILLVPICVAWINTQFELKQQRGFDLIFKAPTYPSSDDPPPPPDPSAADPRWSHFLMDGRLSSNKDALKAFQDSLSEIERSENRYSGLHIHFGDATTYGTVMAALEICRNTVQGYSINDRDLWAFYIPREPTNPDPEGRASEGLIYDAVIHPPYPAPGRQWYCGLIDTRPSISIPRELWPIVAIYLLLIVASYCKHRQLFH